MAIEVSIVCLVYNQEKYVDKMLKSLVNQKTNFEYEILVHDDASTDLSQKIIKDYATKFPDLVKPILQTENQYSKGINPNRQYNYPRVKGKYIAYCEGDDYWESLDKLQKQYDALEKETSCSICVHDVQCVFRDGKTSDKKFPPIKIQNGIITSEQYLRLELKDAGWLFQTSSYFIRTEVIKKFVKEYSVHYPVGDLPLVLFSLQHGDCFYLNETMSCYRLNSGGVMTQLSSRKRRISHCKKMIEGHLDFDKRTKFKYHEYFEYAILSKEVEILMLEKKYHEMLAPKYKDVRKKMNTKKKMLIGLGCVFPELADTLEIKKNSWTE